MGRLHDKPYFINFQNILCARTEPVYQPDGIHLQDAGRKMGARRLEETLKERLAAGNFPGKPQ
jgi:lysophospholipase L1-like esterase